MADNAGLGAVFVSLSSMLCGRSSVGFGAARALDPGDAGLCRLALRRRFFGKPMSLGADPSASRCLWCRFFGKPMIGDRVRACSSVG